MNRILTTLLLAALLLPSAAHAKSWDKARLRKEVRTAAKHYKLTKAETRWLERAAVDIVFRLPGKPRCESSGGWRVGSKSGCYGIFQFNRAWKRPKAITKKLGISKRIDWRQSPRASTWRFVKVYKDGGKAKIRQHWKATLGR